MHIKTNSAAFDRNQERFAQHGWFGQFQRREVKTISAKCGEIPTEGSMRPMHVKTLTRRMLLSIQVVLSLTSWNSRGNETSDSKQGDASAKIDTPETVDTTSRSRPTQARLTVIVLPPDDRMALRGISPDVQKYLATEVSKDIDLTLIKLSHKQLVNVSMVDIFDKKHCKPIADRIKVDIFVMSRLVLVTETGNMATDRWNLNIRIFNANTDTQHSSKIVARKLTSDGIRRFLTDKHGVLTAEIKGSH